MHEKYFQKINVEIEHFSSFLPRDAL